MSLTRPLTRPLTNPLTRAITQAGGGRMPSPTLLEQVLALNPAWVFDASQAANLATDTGGTTPITTAGQTAAYMADLTPNGHQGTQATAANRPTYRGVPRTVGAELIAEPRFASSTGWTTPTGWSIGSGVATKTAGTANALAGAVTLTPGSTYMLTLDMTRTAGTLTITVTGGTTITGHANNTSRSTTFIFTAVTGNTAISLSADATFAGTIKKCSVVEALTMTNYGLAYDGQNDRLATNAINLSGSNKGTVSTMMRWHGGQGGTFRAYDCGNYTPGAGNGAFVLGRASNNIQFRDGATVASASQPITETPNFQTGAQAENATITLDRAGVTIADQIKCRERGFQVTLSTSGSALDDEGLTNAALTVGSANNGTSPMYGIIARQVGFSGAATSDQIALFEAYCREGYTIGAVLGDSTTAACKITSGQPSDNWYVSGFVGGLIVNGADISTPGDRIADQLGDWAALTGKSALEVVVVGGFVNDIKGRSGALPTPVPIATVLADLQDLIDTIAADAPQAQIIILAASPCRGWLDGTAPIGPTPADDPAAAYAAWQAYNVAIAGGGPTPITGVDAVVDGFVSVIGDGSGYLLAEYDNNGDGVHEDNAARFIIAQEIRGALESLGLV
jgi:hypothetical protein